MSELKKLEVDLFTKDAGEKTKEVIEGFKKVKKQKTLKLILVWFS